VACNGVPQLPQNFVPAGFDVPHFGHVMPTACSGAPQLLQNFAVCGFWKLHFGHNTIGAAGAGAGAG
jgi:hypothetical protein